MCPCRWITTVRLATTCPMFSLTTVSTFQLCVRVGGSQRRAAVLWYLPPPPGYPAPPGGHHRTREWAGSDLAGHQGTSRGAYTNDPGVEGGRRG